MGNYIRYTADPTEVNISDHNENGLLLKRKARLQRLLFEHLLNGRVTLELLVMVRHFAPVPGDPAAYGLEVTDSRFLKERDFTFEADMFTLVDAATGAIVARRGEETDEEWQVLAESFAGDTMLQTEHFLRVRDYAHINLKELFENHLLVADQPGFDRYR